MNNGKILVVEYSFDFTKKSLERIRRQLYQLALSLPTDIAKEDNFLMKLLVLHNKITY